MYDLIGIGTGVFNLSLAALLAPIKTVSSLFLEKKKGIDFHGGARTPHSRLQMSFIKDLVTPVDPTNPYSFLNYLVKHKKLYPFINLENSPSLNEFNSYMTWVGENLKNVQFNQEVENIRFEEDHFSIQTQSCVHQSRHIVLGSGLIPYIPPYARPYIGENVTHNSQFLPWVQNKNLEDVVVIGGGQSAADTVHYLLHYCTFNSLEWINPNSNLWVLDDSPFVNELFNPTHSFKFYNYSKHIKKTLLEEFKIASDGISITTLRSISFLLYEMIHVKKKDSFKLRHLHYLRNMIPQENHLQIELQHALTKEVTAKNASQIILCTGYEYASPPYLRDFSEQYGLQGEFKIMQDYSISWPGDPQNRIYIQNSGTRSHGIADPNIGLTAWRNALIINSVSQQTVYEVDQLPLVPNTYM